MVTGKEDNLSVTNYRYSVLSVSPHAHPTPPGSYTTHGEHGALALDWYREHSHSLRQRSALAGGHPASSPSDQSQISVEARDHRAHRPSPRVRTRASSQQRPLDR